MYLTEYNSFGKRVDSSFIKEEALVAFEKVNGKRFLSSYKEILELDKEGGI